MKNFFAIIISVGVIIFSSVVQAAEPPKISADAAILVEASTGRIIYEKNSDMEREPASMTKMLTSILALEKLNPQDEIKVSRTAIFTEDTALNWAENDSLSATDMITAVMLVSENGGAIALAQAVSGNVTQFADLMNEKAKLLDCTHSHFINPNGLPAPNHYSTAADMARIAVYCMKNSDFRKIVETRRTSIHWLTPKDKWAELNNTNELLGSYRGANGIKTGWTMAAGGCLAASAKRGDLELIAVVMHSTDSKTRFEDVTDLFNYGLSASAWLKALTRSKRGVRSLSAAARRQPFAWA